MKWKCKRSEKEIAWCRQQPRVIEKFLLFPININGEYRWLEKAKIQQVVKKYCVSYDMGASDIYEFKWVNEKWVK